MDIISHAATGAIITGLVVDRPTRKLLLIGAGMALFPDIDTVAAVFGRQGYFDYHRVLAHSAIFIVVISPLLGLFVQRRGWMSFQSGTLLALLAMISHLALDTMTSWGTAILYPFSPARYALNLVFMFDIWYPTILILTLWWCLKKNDRLRFGVGLMISCAYFVTAAFLKSNAQSEFSEKIRGVGIEKSEDLFMVAQPWSIYAWAGFARVGHEIHFAKKAFNQSSFGEISKFTDLEETPELRQATETQAVQKFLNFARLPVVELVMIGELRSYRWTDLSKAVSGLERSNENFGVRVDFNSEGQMVYQGFSVPN